MRVLIAHNRYQSATPSGENRIVESEIELLRAADIDVVPYIEDSDELTGHNWSALGTAAVGPLLSPRGVRRLGQLIREHRPDIVHLHNVFPLISPWAVRTAVSAGIPVVQTVHNYRHTCVAGQHLRDSDACEACCDHRFPWPAVAYGCYRGSRFQSAAMAFGQVAHRSTWRRVSRFLTASPLMAERLVSAGVPASSVEWRPTFAEDNGVTALPEHGGVAFVGRLEHAKGIELLLESWTAEVADRWGRLTIAGGGPLQSLVQRRAAQDPTVEWRGSVDGAGVLQVMRESSLVALPSLWFEGFPRVAAEAMSLGRPLVMWEGAGFSKVSEYGAGWAIPSDPEAWTHRLLTLDDAALGLAAGAARRFFVQFCSPSTSVQQLERVYGDLVDRPAP